MKRYKKILVHLTLDETDRSIIRYINHFSKISRSEHIEFLYVIPDSDIASLPAYHVTEINCDTEGVYSEITRLIANFMEALPWRNTKISVCRGHVIWEILRRSMEGDFDLIALEKDHRNFLFSEKISRKSPCSVLLINPSAEPDFRKVAVATDGSVDSKPFIELAANLVVNRKLPKLFLYHAVESSWFSRVRRSEDLSGAEKLMREARTSIEAITRDLMNLPFDLVPYFVEETEAWRGAMDFCEHLFPDILIIGARGKHSKSQLLLGGNAEQLIRIIDAPLLIYKPKGVGTEFLKKLLEGETS